jgi:transposase
MEKSHKRRKYDAAFKAEVLCIARENCSTQAAARALNISLKCAISGSKKSCWRCQLFI